MYEEMARKIGDLGDHLSKDISKHPGNFNLQVQFYKTCFGLYYTPNRIAKWGDGKGAYCPRCSAHKADIIHMFATCNKLEPLIRDIKGFLKEKLHLQVELDAPAILLGISTLTEKQGGAMLIIAVAVYRLCIASAWLDPIPPSFQQWVAQLLAIFNLEKAIYRRRGRKAKSKGFEIWKPVADWVE